MTVSLAQGVTTDNVKNIVVVDSATYTGIQTYKTGVYKSGSNAAAWFSTNPVLNIHANGSWEYLSHAAALGY